MLTYHGILTNGLLEFDDTTIRPIGLRFDSWKTYFEYKEHLTIPDLCCMIEHLTAVELADWRIFEHLRKETHQKSFKMEPPWGASKSQWMDALHLQEWLQWPLIDHVPGYADFGRWTMVLQYIIPGYWDQLFPSRGRHGFEPIHQGRVLQNYTELRQAVFDYLNAS